MKPLSVGVLQWLLLPAVAAVAFLSGAQPQRVAIARAPANRPGLVAVTHDLLSRHVFDRVLEIADGLLRVRTA